MTHSLPPLESLIALRAVASAGSLTAAADELGLTHGAVSRRIAALEHWLGQTLFERHGRGMRLTPDGQRYAGRIAEALELIAGAGDRLRPRRGPETVKISVVPSFAKLWLFERLDALQGGKHADLWLDIAVEHRNADVEAGDVDLAVRYGNGRWRGLDATLLRQEQLRPYGRGEIAREIGPEAEAGALLRHTLLHDSEMTGWRLWFEAQGLTLKPRPSDRRFEDYTLVLAGAQAGLGLCLARLPWTKLSPAGPLVPLSAVTVPSPLNYYVLTRQREQRPAVLVLRDRLVAMAGAG